MNSVVDARTQTRGIVRKQENDMHLSAMLYFGMTQLLTLGINGAAVPASTHLCGFYRGLTERNDLMHRFLAEGIRCEESCFCIVDGTEVSSFTLELQKEVGDFDDAVLSFDDTYFRHGRFSAAGMIEYLETMTAQARSAGDGISSVRGVADMAWVNSDRTELAEVLRYECALNQFVKRYPQVLLCLYDLDHFGGEVLMDIVMTHRKCIMGSVVITNEFYVEPSELLAARE